MSVALPYGGLYRCFRQNVCYTLQAVCVVLCLWRTVQVLRAVCELLQCLWRTVRVLEAVCVCVTLPMEDSTGVGGSVCVLLCL